MTSVIAAGGSGRSASVIPAVPAAWSVTTIAFILDTSLYQSSPHAVWTILWTNWPAQASRSMERQSSLDATVQLANAGLWATTCDRPDIALVRGFQAMTRPFRFGVVAPLRTDLPTWRDRVSRIADAGYSTLLMPDVPQWQPAPGPTLAVAATLADLRVGTWVYASPVRPPWTTAWEAHSLSVLTDGRFEMGIGTGRPGIEDHLRVLVLTAAPPS